MDRVSQEHSEFPLLYTFQMTKCHRPLNIHKLFTLEMVFNLVTYSYFTIPLSRSVMTYYSLILIKLRD